MKLRSSPVAAVCSKRQPLTRVCSVLSLLNVPEGCDPVFCNVLFRFRMLRRYLAHGSHEVRRIYHELSLAGDRSPGHGLESVKKVLRDKGFC